MDGGPAFGALSDAQGRFRVEGVEPGYNGEPDGSQPIAVRAKGFAPWWSEIELAAGETTTVTAQLGFRAGVDGVVLDAQGRPAANVLVTAKSDRFGSKRFLSRGATTLADGTFRTDGSGAAAKSRSLPARPSEAARARGSRSRRTSRRAGKRGSSSREDASRVAWSTIWALRSRAGPSARSTRTTRRTTRATRSLTSAARSRSRTGRRTATALAVREADRWRGTACLVVRDVELGREDLELVVERARMASAFVEGRILGPGGLPVASAAISCRAFRAKLSTSGRKPISRAAPSTSVPCRRASTSSRSRRPGSDARASASARFEWTRPSISAR